MDRDDKVWQIYVTLEGLKCAHNKEWPLPVLCWMTVLSYWSPSLRVSSFEKTENLMHHVDGCDSEMSLAYIRQV